MGFINYYKDSDGDVFTAHEYNKYKFADKVHSSVEDAAVAANQDYPTMRRLCWNSRMGWELSYSHTLNTETNEFINIFR